MIEIQRYQKEHRSTWDNFISSANNRSFLHNRDYMEYHRERFSDYSLLVKDNGKLIAVLAANKRKNVLISHEGLTYGGLILGKKYNTSLILNIFESLLEYLAHHDIREFIYKPMPYIYADRPSQEDLFAFKYFGGELTNREISSTVDMTRPLLYSKGKKRLVRKANGEELSLSEKPSFNEFFSILENELFKKYKKKPVHTLQEIEYLHNKFQRNINLYTVIYMEQIIAGTIIYETGNVAHAQYISSNTTGKQMQALDFLFDYLLRVKYREIRYFDFGISTEEGGTYVNPGLLQFKEGFGASGVCYDSYRLQIK